MDTATLIQKLLEIEMALGKADPLALKAMLREVEDCVLGLEKWVLAVIAENERLRSARCPHTALCTLCHPDLAVGNAADAGVRGAVPASFMGNKRQSR